MDNLSSAPVKRQKNWGYPDKQPYAVRGSFTCPPVAPKSKKAWSVQRSLFSERDLPKPVYFLKPVALSRIYSSDDVYSYFDQIFMKDEAIGEGSFGVVYRVRSREDDKYYAIKQLKASHALQYGYAEVQNWEKVGLHKNCVQYYMAWEENKIIYLKMEYCQLSLAQYAKETPNINETQLFEILNDILNALDYLHTKNLVHLDVKPGNIMMHLGCYKLADFGLLVDLNENSGRKISTLSDGDARYLACEVLSGVYTYSCDIFGLGISLLELAANIQLPEFGNLWHQIRKNELPQTFYEAVSTSFSSIIEDMMVIVHWKRPTAAKILKSPVLKRIQTKDLDTPRQIYAHESLPCNILLQSGKVASESSNIIETPRRPLAEIRGNFSNENSFRRLSSSKKLCLSDSLIKSRRSLLRAKLNFEEK